MSSLTAPASFAGLQAATRAKPLGAWGAIRIANRTTWRQPQFYVLTAVVMQLFLVLLAVPLLRMLYSLVLVETGLGSVAYDQILNVLLNPLADLTLLILASVAVVAIVVELTTLFILAAHHQAGDSTSFRLVLRQVGWTIRKLAHPTGVLIIVYLLLLLPLGQLGLSSTFTKHIGVPPFISGELHKSATTSGLYTALLVVLVYVNLRLILTLPLLATTSATVWQAFVTSWRLTRWRTLRIVGMLAFMAVMVVIPVAILFVITLVPTLVIDQVRPDLSAAAAAVGLAVLAGRRLPHRRPADDLGRPGAGRADAGLAAPPAGEAPARRPRDHLLRGLDGDRVPPTQALVRDRGRGGVGRSAERRWSTTAP